VSRPSNRFRLLGIQRHVVQELNPTPYKQDENQREPSCEDSRRRCTTNVSARFVKRL
jgi:hypothetical protein